MHRVILNADLGAAKISKHIYGHFAEHLGRCVYEGLWVGEDSPIPNTRGFRNDVVNALKNLSVPNLRWPGGCFADTYHWMDGIGPREKRPSMINVHWGGTVENKYVGTHEFLDLCEMIGCEPYIAGNVGSGSVREMNEWMEYLTMPGQSPMADLRRKNGRDEPWNVRLWGIGNENWGCGGQMRPEYYADLYRQFRCYSRNYTPDAPLYRVACGFLDEWNHVLMREAAGQMEGLSVHYYTVPGDWKKKGSATEFDADDWKLTLQKAANIEPFIQRTASIMDRYDPEKRVGIVMDEWGTWFDVEPGTNPGHLYQQQTMRDALVAGISLNVFNNHAERVHVANLAQTVNVLQAVALTDGPKMLLTPTYHVFEMFKAHQDATLLPTSVTGDDYAETRPMVGTAGAGGTTTLLSTRQISASASRAADGPITLTLCNLHHADAADLSCEIRGQRVTTATGRVLTGEMRATNTFDAPDRLVPQPLDGIRVTDDGVAFVLPLRSVATVRLA